MNPNEQAIARMETTIANLKQQYQDTDPRDYPGRTNVYNMLRKSEQLLDFMKRKAQA